MNRFDAIENLIESQYDIKTDGKAIWADIEKQVASNGLSGTQDIEIPLYKNEKKHNLKFRVEISRSYDEELDEGYTDINFIDIR